MPTYLLHGFRWPRPLIRIHIILQNLDDAAAEWLMAPPTTATLIQNLTTLYPTALPSLPNLRFIEQYDPTDLSSESKSQPFAYVADIVHEVKLGLDVDETRGHGIPNEQWGAMVELRDAIAPGEKVAWWVVVCGDVERWAPPTVGLLMNGAGSVAAGERWGGESGYYGSSSSYNSAEGSRPQSARAGFMKLLSKTSQQVRKSKSLRTLRRSGSQISNGTSAASTTHPPMPTTPLPSSRPPPLFQEPGTAV